MGRGKGRGGGGGGGRIEGVGEGSVVRMCVVQQNCTNSAVGVCVFMVSTQGSDERMCGCTLAAAAHPVRRGERPVGL